MDAVEVLANTQAGDPAIAAVMAGGTLTIHDSKITTTAVGDTAAVYARGNTTIQRSLLVHGEANMGYALRFSNTTAPFTIVVDSHRAQGRQHRRALRHRHRGDDDRDARRHDRPVDRQQRQRRQHQPERRRIDGRRDDQQLDPARPRGPVANGAQATCSYSNLPTVGFSGTPNCPTTDGNPLGNTKLMTSELRLDPDFAPLYDSPAVDSGDPAGVAPGESPGDRLGRRRAASSADTCDAGPGIRDRGAFERYRPLPAATIIGPDSLPAGTATFQGFTDSRDPVFTWAWGDGADGGGSNTTSRALGVGGSKITLTVNDRVYNCSNAVTKNFTVTAAAGGGSKDKTAPKLSKVKLAKSIKRKGTATLRYTLSEAATVTITVGRVKGKKLVATKKFSVKGKKGANATKLTAKRFKWRKARYGVKLAAKDAAGNSAKSVSLKLSVR